MTHRIWIILYVSTITSCFGQNIKNKLCYQPIGLPIDICVDNDYNLGVNWSSSYVTLLGTFKVSLSLNENIEDVIPHDEYRVKLKYGDSLYLFQIEKSVELRIESNSGFTGSFQSSTVEIELSEENTTMIWLNNLNIEASNQSKKTGIRPADPPPGFSGIVIDLTSEMYFHKMFGYGTAYLRKWKKLGKKKRRKNIDLLLKAQKSFGFIFNNGSPRLYDLNSDRLFYYQTAKARLFEINTYYQQYQYYYKLQQY